MNIKKNYTDYTFFGAHLISENGQSGTRFAVWAPHADQVNVVGPFNNWRGEFNPMQKTSHKGVWSLFVPDLGVNTIYKYEIITRDGNKFHKIDPVAFSNGIPPDFSCRVVDLSQFEWEDGDWQKEKSKKDKWHQPISVYEVHLGSWRRHHDGSYYSYIDLAHSLADYVKYLGFTHIELMPVMEHPFDGSWGYQCTGYYAPNSRFGHPIDLMYFVDYCHKIGLGVILDFVPGHFCRDKHALAWYDGKACYEYNAHERSTNNNWGSNNFAIGRTKVQNFLISSALYWIEKYHIDGLRVDAVADTLHISSMSGNAGIRFMKKLNNAINENFPGTLTIAEDSSARGHLTDGGENGLGFSYRWNMGWSHDILSYMKHNPYDRKHHHRQLIFPLEYAGEENFILSLSHDEMAHGRGSLMSKMYGTDEEKLKNLKVLITWQFMHPGKKLLFMGTELAQADGWRFDSQLDWNQLKYKKFQQFHLLIKHLNEIYKAHKALWQLDRGNQGTIIQLSDFHNSIVVLRRQGWDNADFLIVVMNFSASEFSHYHIGVPMHGAYRILLSTDWRQYGGNSESTIEIPSENFHWQELSYRIEISIPPLSAQIVKKA